MLEYLYALFGVVRSEEDGQTAVEYALVLALIAIVLVLALAGGLTGALDSAIGKITSALA